MKVVVLVENTACGQAFQAQHGLSFYIETGAHKILFDCGANGLFLQNAARLGIDISAVDYVILSHGHYDHGGGLGDFIRVNGKAKILVSRYAFGDYYFKLLCFNKYIGLDQSLKNSDRLVFVDGSYEIDSNTILFSDITGDKFRSVKSKLYKRVSGKLVRDDFRHEQCLVAGDVLFAGCAHTGIVNIYEKAKAMRPIRHIFGGFHLYSPAGKKTESKELIEGIANEFCGEDVQIYTGHCTGKKAFSILWSVLGGKIEAISTGKVYEIGARCDNQTI